MLSGAPAKRIGLSNPAWLLVPAVLVLVGFFGLPMLTILLYSFGRAAPGVIYVPDFSFDNYASLFTTSVYFTVMLRTLRLGLIVTLLALVIGYPYAYLLARGRPWLRSILLVTVLLPLLVSVVVRTFGWMVVLGLDGPLNVLLVGSGALDRPLKLIYNEVGVVIGLLHVYFPFMVLPLSTVLQKIDPDLEAAARALGADSLTTFRRITLPLSVPGIAAGSMLVFTLSAAAYVTPALMGGAAFNMMATLVAQQILVLLNWPLGAAVAIVLVLTTLLVVTLYNRVLVSRAGLYRGSGT